MSYFKKLNNLKLDQVIHLAKLRIGNDKVQFLNLKNRRLHVIGKRVELGRLIYSIGVKFENLKGVDVVTSFDMDMVTIRRNEIQYLDSLKVSEPKRKATVRKSKSRRRSFF